MIRLRFLPLVLALAVALAALPAVAHAQEAAPVPTPTPAAQEAPAGPNAEDFAAAFLGGLPALLQKVPQFFGTWLGEGIERLLRLVWDAAAHVFGPVNIFTQLPDLWTYNLPAVGLARARLAPVAAALVGLALALTVLLAGLGTLLGRPFGWLLNRLPYLLLAGAGLAAAPQLMAWWIGLVNSLSGALLDPLTGLPGLSQLTAVGQLLDIVWVAVLYAGFAVWFLFHRLKVLVLAALCVAVAPLAIAVGVLPFPLAQRFFSLWLTTFLGVTAVQVLQAVCLGIGANVIVVGSAYSGGASEVMAGLVGAGSLLAAGAVPKLVLGGLAGTTTGGAGAAGGLVKAAVDIGLVVAGLGAVKAAAGAATVTQVVAQQGAVAGARSGHVVSLLGGRTPLLPAPKS